MSEQVRIDRCPRCKASGVSVEVKSAIKADKFVIEKFGQCGICDRGIILRILPTGSYYVLDYCLYSAPAAGAAPLPPDRSFDRRCKCAFGICRSVLLDF